MERDPANNGARPALEFKKVRLMFGGVTVLLDVSLEIKKHEILAVIGPNGAGKTCILNCISGYYRPQKGEILYNGKVITRMPRHRIAKMGIGRTFQNTELFEEMTALENIMLGRHRFLKSNVLTQALYFGWNRKQEIGLREVAENIIDFLELRSCRKSIVGSLSYGLQKRIQMGQALAMEPDLLLLDEPLAGMNLEEKEDMVRFILDISEEKGTTILLIEHDMGVVMDIADRVIVIDFGVKISEGPPEVVKSDQKVIKAYLGE